MAKKTTTPAAKTTKSKTADPVIAPDAPTGEPVKETKPRATSVPKKAAKPTATTTEVTDEMVAEHAYHLWQSGHPGDHVEHWTTAERNLRGKK